MSSIRKRISQAKKDSPRGKKRTKHRIDTENDHQLREKMKVARRKAEKEGRNLLWTFRPPGIQTTIGCSTTSRATEEEARKALDFFANGMGRNAELTDIGLR